MNAESKYRLGIIGGSGYVGSTLAKYLLNYFTVKVIDQNSVPKHLENKVEYCNCDVRNLEQLSVAVSDVDLVIHSAIIQIPVINEKKNLAYEINVLGTQNACEAVEKSSRTKGLILTGSWHVIGERELKGSIDEEFGFRPDKVEERARLYALTKIAQETIVRLYDEKSSKTFGVIRMGTVLGEGMPEKTAANIFVDKGLKGEALTPFSQSMYRPMLYVDVNDICRAFGNFASIIINNPKGIGNSLSHVINVFYPYPITIIELAEITKASIIENTNGKINPPIRVVNSDTPVLFTPEDKDKIKVDSSKASNYLKLANLRSPKESINELVKEKLRARLMS